MNFKDFIKIILIYVIAQKNNNNKKGCDYMRPLLSQLGVFYWLGSKSQKLVCKFVLFKRTVDISFLTRYIPGIWTDTINHLPGQGQQTLKEKNLYMANTALTNVLVHHL